MKLTFNKHEKLKSKKLIKLLFENGEKINVFPMLLMYLKVEHDSKYFVQAGVTVSKRNFNKAVNRNRIKRLLRESYRLNKPFLYEKLENNVDLKESKYIFMFIYLGKKEVKQIILHEKMKELLGLFFSKIERKIDKKRN